MRGYGIFDEMSGSRPVRFLVACLLLPLFSHPGRAQTRGQTGAWSAVISLPIIPVSAALSS
jgi:hypothetical protein